MAQTPQNLRHHLLHPTAAAGDSPDLLEYKTL
jgi:hypothetical protein